MKIRHIFSRKIFLFGSIIVVFLLGQFMGAFAIKHFFIQYKIQELQPQIASIANDIAQNDLKMTKKNEFVVKAYDIYQKEIDIFSDAPPSKFSFSDDKIKQTLTSYMPKIISGKTVANLQKIGTLPSQSVVIGVPLKKDNSIIGAVFLLKPASDFKAALNGFYLVFFIAIAIGSILISIVTYLYFKEAKLLEQTRRNYIANIGHELKTPIASIKALTETLADHVITDDIKRDRYYGIILSESSRLQKLISDMLELSKLQSGKLAFEKTQIDTKKLIQSVDDKFCVLADDMGIEFVVTQKAKNIPNLYSNEDRILQVLNILIDNAMKFVGDDGKITIDARYNSKEATIMVRDNGVGIEKDIIEFVFDRFYKEDKAHNKNGSGLGLSIAKEIIESLGGRIYVESEYGKQTTFYFTVKIF